MNSVTPRWILSHDFRCDWGYVCGARELDAERADAQASSSWPLEVAAFKLFVPRQPVSIAWQSATKGPMVQRPLSSQEVSARVFSLSISNSKIVGLTQEWTRTETVTDPFYFRPVFRRCVSWFGVPIPEHFQTLQTFHPLNQPAGVCTLIRRDI